MKILPLCNRNEKWRCQERGARIAHKAPGLRSENKITIHFLPSLRVDESSQTIFVKRQRIKGYCNGMNWLEMQITLMSQLSDERVTTWILLRLTEFTFSYSITFQLRTRNIRNLRNSLCTFQYIAQYAISLWSMKLNYRNKILFRVLLHFYASVQFTSIFPASQYWYAQQISKILHSTPTPFPFDYRECTYTVLLTQSHVSRKANNPR